MQLSIGNATIEVTLTSLYARAAGRECYVSWESGQRWNLASTEGNGKGTREVWLSKLYGVVNRMGPSERPAPYTAQ